MGKTIKLGLYSKGMKDTVYLISSETLREAIKLIAKDEVTGVCFFKMEE